MKKIKISSLILAWFYLSSCVAGAVCQSSCTSPACEMHSAGLGPNPQGNMGWEDQQSHMAGLYLSPFLIIKHYKTSLFLLLFSF